MNGSTRQKISLQNILLNFFEALMIAFGPNCKKSRTVKGLDRTSSKDFSKVVIQNDLLTHILLHHENFKEFQNFFISIKPNPPCFSGSLA